MNMTKTYRTVLQKSLATLLNLSTLVGKRVFAETGHVTHSQFHATTSHLVLVLFVSQLPKYEIPYLLTFCSLKHSLHLDVI